MVERKKIFFKFIIDGEWLYSNDYLKAPDKNGNLNNYIDLWDPERSIYSVGLGTMEFSSDEDEIEEEEKINDL